MNARGAHSSRRHVTEPSAIAWHEYCSQWVGGAGLSGAPKSEYEWLATRDATGAAWLPLVVRVRRAATDLGWRVGTSC
jgi:hypothetical protein